MKGIGRFGILGLSLALGSVAMARQKSTDPLAEYGAALEKSEQDAAQQLKKQFDRNRAPQNTLPATSGKVPEKPSDSTGSDTWMQPNPWAAQPNPWGKPPETLSALPAQAESARLPPNIFKPDLIPPSKQNLYPVPESSTSDRQQTS
jgi:hypothetical protein